MYYEAIFQPSEKMNYNTDAKRLAGKKNVHIGTSQGDVDLDLFSPADRSVLAKMLTYYHDSA
jgi:hypothetical protein